MDTLSNRLIAGLLDPSSHPTPCSQVELVETHISWVLLTGTLAYKIKKPVDLGFADFTTLERRRHFCEEEIRLNGRLAPELYLRCVPITGDEDDPKLDGDGPAIEYAVCMRQFDQTALLSHVPRNRLTVEHIDRLARECAQFHATALLAAPATAFGTPKHVIQPVRDNFQVLRDADESIHQAVCQLEEHAESQFQRLHVVFEQRKNDSMIRECHGDLHLGNMFLQDDRIHVFDGIEFNDDLRWIDIINDIAFAVMDLKDRGYDDLSRRFLNRWLEYSGDYSGVRVIPFYCSYRAAVRAKIDAIRMHQPDVPFSELRHLSNDCRGYLDLASFYGAAHTGAIIITFGPSGSGKTTITDRLVDGMDCIRVRSDVERKRLFGLAPSDDSNDQQKRRMYTAEASRKTYDRLRELAALVVSSGFPAVIDATFLAAQERQMFRDLAESLNVPFVIIECKAEPAELAERIRKRNETGTNASEADERVLDQQLQHIEELSPWERKYTVRGTGDDIVTAVQLQINTPS